MLAPFQHVQPSEFNVVSDTAPIVTVAQLLSCVQLFLTPSGFFVHGISQAGILKWLTVSFSRRSSQPRDQTCGSCIGRWTFPLSHQGSPQPLLCILMTNIIHELHKPSTVLRNENLLLNLIKYTFIVVQDFPMAQTVKNSPAKQKTWVRKVPWRRE